MLPAYVNYIHNSGNMCGIPKAIWEQVDLGEWHANQCRDLGPGQDVRLNRLLGETLLIACERPEELVSGTGGAGIDLRHPRVSVVVSTICNT